MATQNDEPNDVGMEHQLDNVSDHDIEELDFNGSAQGNGGSRMKRSAGKMVAIVLAVIVAIGGLGTAGGWYWYNNLRQYPVIVDGQIVNIRNGHSIERILQDNADFQKVPGRLISLTGKVLDDKGGEPIKVTVNGVEVPQDKLASTHLKEQDEVTLENGADKEEEHEDKVEVIPHGKKATNIVTGGIIQLHLPGSDGTKETWVGKVSGEVVDKGVTKEPVDEQITALTPHVPADRKVIALTFDDGPSEYTPKMLDIFKEKGVHVTFFNIGTQSAEMKDTVKRMVDEGHQVGSHSNTHPFLPKLSDDGLRSELTAGFDGLASAGVTSRMFRSPYGAFTNKDWERAGDLISTNVLWDIDTLDWKMPGAQAIHDTVLKQAHNGAIALMHTGGGNREQDIEALPGIIDDLKAQGYEFVTVGELMAMDQKQRFPEWAIKGELPTAAASASES
ncbi:polysaccharide deacetylase family protein [Bifidobacterium vespertilionis]|uniref:polysaccharide deacetylase family protein n=1 Tax=Bifidobacterium vespertilionis TaxID=2562524 RepID=UPI001BDC0A6E|nr:polysaccharide deacetylase family protein [Bifidobacterium vespertilionis]